MYRIFTGVFVLPLLAAFAFAGTSAVHIEDAAAHDIDASTESTVSDHDDWQPGAPDVQQQSTAQQGLASTIIPDESSAAAACGLFLPCEPAAGDPCAPCGLTCTYVYYRVDFLCLPSFP